ncbi:hypothetical protein [Mycoplasma sp. HU2014]|uniref:hypothetical protein n=1 Tax=Mycoplasma sp. HU2014 TaxID=1664275 RepID=UPI00067AA020|nr:hypothetical protein [Mycoplasma sp. HU2014]KNG79702.1 hypothetical protein AB668_00380 [Mycoplasma sp. HU2014]
MSNNHQEIELDFFEPSLGLIIANLDNVLDELNKDNNNYKQLENLINEFENIENLDNWDELVNKLEKLELQIIKELLNIKDSSMFNLISSLQISKHLAFLLKQNNFVFKNLNDLEMNAKALKWTSQQEYIDFYKQVITNQVNDVLKEHKLLFEQLNSQKDEFKKVYNLLISEQNFDDLLEGNKILIDILKLNINLNDTLDLKRLDILNKVEAYLEFINFWQQTINLEEE